MPLHHSHSPEETQALGYQWGKTLPIFSVVALYGDLGAGKTLFVKGLTTGVLGISPEEITSPTFSYLHIYKGSKTVYHFDLYRLRNSDDFLSLGFEEYFRARGICCIEWAERIADLLPPHTIHVELRLMQETQRAISWR